MLLMQLLAGERAQGTGFGLSGVRRRLALFGGSLDLAAAKSAGAAGYVAKDDPGEVLEAIRQALGGREYL